MNVYYEVPAWSNSDRFSIETDCVEWLHETDKPQLLASIANECAIDFYLNCGGTGLEWPTEFVLFATEEGLEAGRVRVDLEIKPQFSTSDARFTFCGSNDEEI